MLKRLSVVVLFTALSLVVASCGGSSGTTTTEGTVGDGNIARGADVYKGTCATCHGGDAKGIDGLGKSLVNNAFIADQTEESLAAFIKVGRDRDDPDNTTGVAMPPKGGNPSLSEQDLRDVSAYLISLNP